MKLKTKFQDEIFESGEVVDAFCYGEADRIRVNAYANDNERDEYIYYYNSIKDFTDHWEDASEGPKDYWFMDAFGNIIQNRITKNRGDAYTDMSSDYEMQKKIGNYFESKEEAEAALEKLKAFTRLKDKGLVLDWSEGRNYVIISLRINDQEAKEDLDLLFGGEE